MALTQFSSIAGYYHGVLAATEAPVATFSCANVHHNCVLTTDERLTETVVNFDQKSVVFSLVWLFLVTLWCQLEDTVLLIGTLLLFDPVLFPKYEA